MLSYLTTIISAGVEINVYPLQFETFETFMFKAITQKPATYWCPICKHVCIQTGPPVFPFGDRGIGFPWRSKARLPTFSAHHPWPLCLQRGFLWGFCYSGWQWWGSSVFVWQEAHCRWGSLLTLFAFITPALNTSWPKRSSQSILAESMDLATFATSAPVATIATTSSNTTYASIIYTKNVAYAPSRW